MNTKHVNMEGHSNWLHSNPVDSYLKLKVLGMGTNFDSMPQKKCGQENFEMGKGRAGVSYPCIGGRGKGKGLVRGWGMVEGSNEHPKRRLRTGGDKGVWETEENHRRKFGEDSARRGGKCLRDTGKTSDFTEEGPIILSKRRERLDQGFG